VPRIAIIGDCASETNDELALKWCSLGLEAGVMSPGEALALLRPGDIALGRVDVRRSLDGVEPGLLDLLELERRGVLLFNTPRALLAAHDKLRTARLLARAGVPHPETVHVRPGDRLPELAAPCVVKPRFGSWGCDIFRCDSPRALRRTLASVATRPWFRHGGALVQALVPPRGDDLRVLTAAGQVVGAERRLAAAGEWRTNISLGGSHRPASPSREARGLALAAAAALGCDFSGADLLPLEGGYVVIEVNCAVDFSADYGLPGRDVFEDTASALWLLGPDGLAGRPRAVAGGAHGW
jgi:RimK family alpha-L-glutamate ligase